MPAAAGSAGYSLDRRSLAERIDAPVIGLEVVLLLEADLDTFLYKLEQHAQQAIPTTGISCGTGCLSITRVEQERTQLDNVLALRATGNYTDYEACRWFEFPLLEFVARSLPREKHIEVRARIWNFAALLGMFEDVLSAVTAQYPVEPDALQVQTIGSQDAGDYELWHQEGGRFQKALSAIVHSETTSGTSTAYVFRAAGEGWEIAFEGPPFLLKSTKGLGYVALLLSNPNKDIHVLDLVTAETSDAAIATSLNMPGHELAEEGMRLARETVGQPILDDEAIRQIRDEYQELRQELVWAKQTEDTEREAKVTEEMEQLVRELSSSTGLGGRPREFSDEGERARIRVQKQVTNALERIRQNDPALYSHLHAAIRTGFECSYKPETPIPWNL